MLGRSARREGVAAGDGVGPGKEKLMPVQEVSRPQEFIAPNAIHERMRRRIARVGLLVAVVFTLLTALVIFLICACASLR
jgi:hypothetical protein